MQRGPLSAAVGVQASGNLAPSALAIFCAAAHAFGALGLLAWLRAARERLEEDARGLAPLPADAYAAPDWIERLAAAL